MEGQRIRIKLKAYEHAMLDRTTDDIVKTARRTGARVIGPIPLPTKRSVYTVLRSPHVNKKSREQFEIRIHKRLIDLTHTTQQTIDDLTKLVLPEVCRYWPLPLPVVALKMIVELLFSSNPSQISVSPMVA